MAEPWGEILYRAAATVAGLVALLTLYDKVQQPTEGLAAIIWPIGLCCRCVFDVP